MKHQTLLPIVRIITLLSAIGAFILAVGKRLLTRWLLKGMDIPHDNASSIGIIGGADGPTAIYITSVNKAEWLLPLLIITTLAGLVSLFFLKKSDKR